MQDPEIYDLLTGKKKAHNSDIESVIKLIRGIWKILNTPKILSYYCQINDRVHAVFLTII